MGMTILTETGYELWRVLDPISPSQAIAVIIQIDTSDADEVADMAEYGATFVGKVWRDELTRERLVEMTDGRLRPIKSLVLEETVSLKGDENAETVQKQEEEMTTEFTQIKTMFPAVDDKMIAAAERHYSINGDSITFRIENGVLAAAVPSKPGGKIYKPKVGITGPYTHYCDCRGKADNGRPNPCTHALAAIKKASDTALRAATPVAQAADEPVVEEPAVDGPVVGEIVTAPASPGKTAPATEIAPAVDTDLAGEIAALREEVKRLNHDLAGKKQLVDSLANDLHLTLKQNKELHDELEKANEGVSKLSGELEELKKANEEFEKFIQDMSNRSALLNLRRENELIESIGAAFGSAVNEGYAKRLLM